MKLLFVCLGNICRSPAGENVMRQLVANAGLADQITCDSAGTAGYHIGKSPDARMTACLARRNTPNPGAAMKFTADMFDRYDLILAMDQQNYDDIIALANSPEKTAKVKKFCDYCTDHKHTDVPDPYYGGDAGFEEVADLMHDGCSELLRQTRMSLFAS